MRQLFTLLFTLAALTFACALPATAKGLDAEQKTEIEKLVRDYLLEHPEILQDMSARLDEKQRKAETEARNGTMKEAAPGIFHTAIDPTAGNPKGDVTVVEFMDYNCGWCKKAVKEVTALVDTDKKLRVVFKEFPIFGAGSEFAAKAAIAATRQGKYWELHRALYAHEGAINEDVTLAVAKDVGIDIDRLQKDMQDPTIAETITNNQRLAASMQFNGTPAFIVDDKVFPGYVPQSELQAAITAVRANGGCKFC
jgi:protein-disulfide isomerase